MKPYPKYKDSGIEWLGVVPEEWEVNNLKYFSNLTMGQSPNSDEYSDDSDLLPFLQGNADFTDKHPVPRVFCGTANKVITEGSILISVRAPVGALNEADRSYGIGRGLCAVKPRVIMSKDYIWYQLHVIRIELDSLATGSTYDAVSVDEVANITTLLPPIQEQQSIASFLDRETARIDALICKKERMIELLKEKRIALITHAVTKGLDHNVKMKNSGIEWLGEVPEHWIHIVFGRVCTIQSGYAFDSSNFNDDGYPIVQMSNLKRGVLDLSEAKKYPQELCPHDVELDEGDILMGMSGSIGDTGSLGNYAIVTKYDLPCYLNQRVGRLDLSPRLDSGFVSYMIQSIPFFEQIQLSVTGTAQFNISPTQLSDIWIALPPIPDQKNVSLYLDNETSRIDALTRRIENSITLLREYRSSLINAAVTGKIDLREYHDEL